VGPLRKWVWWVTAAFTVVLVVTGVWLSFFYLPTSPPEQPMRVVHRTASIGFPLPVLALGLLHAVERRRSWPWGAGAFVLALGLSFTGYLLPWDQLALYAVTIGTNMRGLVTAAFSNEVKFVLVGSREISQGTIRTWFVVHAAVLPVLLALCLAGLRRRSSTVAPTGV
jgi:quinol-cytochrome oxidoreductase complex cytochrome b subunit